MTQLRAEPVSYSAHRLNVLGALRAILKLLPEPRNMDIDGSRGNVALIFPDVLEQVFARHDGAAAVDQIAKQLEFLGRQRYRLAILPYLAALEIGDDTVEFEVRDSCPTLFHDPPQQRFHASQQLRGIERFGQIVVGAQLQPDYPIHHLTLRRQHENG